MRHSEAWQGPGDEEEEEVWRHRYAHGRGRGRGPGGPGGRGWGFPGPGGPGFADSGPWFGGPRFRGPRVKRGDVRAAAIALLAEGPRNGYQIIQEIGERSGGVWRPSPGSVYPALQQLEDEGLIAATTGDGGRRAYELTDEGRSYVAAHPDELQAPWDVVARSVGGDAIELRRLFGTVAMAAMQVVRVGNAAQVAQAQQILTDARRKLYQILAAGDEEQPAGEQAAGEQAAGEQASGEQASGEQAAE
ncbi:MAG TPA: PadR family transcriptional regulator [Streptosporangiaceae bacterium]|nr:PadR family transcriptional regulator [Streptosporangiaceae bacterium]